MSRTAIVGAGIVGLVTALRLVQRGEDVTVFERDSVPGGLAASFVPVLGGDPLERFYHHIFRSDRHIIALIEELGLRDRLFWSTPITACLSNGRIEQLDSPLSLLRYSQLSVPERLRLVAALGFLKLAPSERPFEAKFGAGWLRNVGGRRAYEAIFSPLFTSKFGEAAEEISLAWFWARIHDRTPSLGYLDGGFSVLYRKLTERIRELGGTFLFNTTVAKIEPADAALRIHLASDLAPCDFDRVVATVPLSRLAALVPELAASFVERYTQRPGLLARCLVLALDRKLTGAYWINVCERGVPFMVAVEHTNLVSADRYQGRHLVYLGNYGTTFPNCTVQSLIDAFTPFIQRLNPAFSQDWVLDAWQFVAPDAQPIVTPAFREHIAPHATPIRALFLANHYQIYPHDRGQNYAIPLAQSAADAVVSAGTNDAAA